MPTISVLELDKLIEGGHRGPVRVRGFYQFHPEEDVLFPRRIDPGSLDYETVKPRVELSFHRLVDGKSRKETYSWRKELGTRLSGHEVEVIGEIKNAPLPANGPWGGQLITRTFLEVVEMKERPNKSPEPTPTAVTPRANELKSDR